MKFTPNLVIGVVITLIGGVLILDRLDVVAVGQALRLWPVLLTVFGLSVIVQALRNDEDGQSAAGGGRPIVSPGLVLFIAVVSVLAWRTEGRSFMRRGEPVDAQQSLVGIMGRDDRIVLSSAFTGAEMTSVMGRTRLDLRKATPISDGTAVVDVFGLMGAVEIVVPAHWVIDSQAWAVMGGVDDKRRQQARAPERDDDAADERRDQSSTASDARSQTIDGTAGTVPPQGRDISSQSVGGSTTAAPDSLAAPTPPRLVIRGMVVMGALVIRS
jgi:hypothetical protein